MLKSWKISSLLVVACAATVLAADLTSGLPVGEAVPPFYVSNVTGQKCVGSTADQRSNLCYRCKFGNDPVVCVFARSTSESLANLTKQLDVTLEKNADSKLKSFVVVVTEDSAATTKQLEQIAEQQKLRRVPLTFVLGDTEISEYSIAKGADLTVMLWNKGTVTASHAFKKGDLKPAQIASVVSDVEKLVK